MVYKTTLDKSTIEIYERKGVNSEKFNNISYKLLNNAENESQANDPTADKPTMDISMRRKTMRISPWAA